MEDSLTDMVCLAISDAPVTSVQDAINTVKNTITNFVQVTDSLVVSGSIDRMAAKVLLFSLGKPAPRVGKLAKLVKQVKLVDKYRVPIVSLYHVGNVPRIVVRIPELSKEDSNSFESFSSIMSLLHYCTGVAVENMSYIMSDELGTSIRFEQVHIKLIDELTASASMPSGVFPGEVIKVGDYQCNLPSILASLHFLARKSAYLRKRSPQGKEKVYTVCSQELRNTFNSRTGLNDKSKSYSTMLLKAALAVITSTTNRTFPGGWIKANRDINRVKSDNGLLYKLGYTEKIPYSNKILSVLNNTVRTKPDSKLHIVNQATPEHPDWNFLEFRAGATLFAPFINHLSGEEFSKQIKREPLSCKNVATIDTFSNTKYYKTINTLNRAHALLLTVGKGGSKTKPIHYEIARNEFLHSCAKIPIIDGHGTERTKLSDLPEPVYGFMKKTFRFNSSKPKRSVEVEDSPQQEQSKSSHPRPAKKKKIAMATTSNDGPSKNTRAKSKERELHPPEDVMEYEDNPSIPKVGGTTWTVDPRPLDDSNW
nr:hypothetical protein [Erysiphe lesion-associated ormycovirus 4]